MGYGAGSDIQDKDGVAPLHTALFSVWCPWQRGESLALLLFREKVHGVRSFPSIQLRCISKTLSGTLSMHFAREVPLFHPHTSTVGLWFNTGLPSTLVTAMDGRPCTLRSLFGNYVTASTLIV